MSGPKTPADLATGISFCTIYENVSCRTSATSVLNKCAWDAYASHFCNRLATVASAQARTTQIVHFIFQVHTMGLRRCLPSINQSAPKRTVQKVPILNGRYTLDDSRGGKLRWQYIQGGQDCFRMRFSAQRIIGSSRRCTLCGQKLLVLFLFVYTEERKLCQRKASSGRNNRTHGCRVTSAVRRRRQTVNRISPRETSARHSNF